MNTSAVAGLDEARRAYRQAPPLADDEARRLSVMGTEVAEKRRETIEQKHDGWTLRIYDNQPIADGQKCAADSYVELLHGAELVRRFTYPSYRIWTLLAHWTDGLPDVPTGV